jgi:hypothetical protein
MPLLQACRFQGCIQYQGRRKGFADSSVHVVPIRLEDLRAARWRGEGGNCR